jgi:hypothetical protein
MIVMHGGSLSGFVRLSARPARQPGSDPATNPRARYRPDADTLQGRFGISAATSLSQAPFTPPDRLAKRT